MRPTRALLLLCVLLFAGSSTAKADTIFVQADFFGSPYVSSYTVPQGQFVVSATITGSYRASFENCCFPGPFPRPFGYYIDGIRVPLGVTLSPTHEAVGTFSYTFDFTPDVLDRFNDGQVIVTHCANNIVFCSNGAFDMFIRDARITLTTSSNPPAGPVPEPATLALLGTGLAGAAFAKRRKARRP